jgi:transposase InsO family protein
MFSVLLSLVQAARVSMRSRAALQLEILALRHQLQVFQRSRRRVHLTQADRLLWVWLSRIWMEWRSAIVIVRPDTVIAWHRRAFRRYWTWKSRHRVGRPAVSADVRALIRTMSQANPLWGAPRMHGELLKLGVEVSQASVSQYLVRLRRPSSQSWRTFLANHVHQILAADVFAVSTATGRLLFVLVMLAHQRRRVVHVAVTEHPTAAWTAQQLREAFPWDDAPQYLIRDRDLAFAAVHATADAMAISEVLTAPRSPWQNGVIERFIGSVRRECLDHVVIFTAAGLKRLLARYIEYYERSQTHVALNKDAPVTRTVSTSTAGRIIAIRRSAAFITATSASRRKMFRLISAAKATDSCPACVRLQSDFSSRPALPMLARLVPAGPSTHGARELERSIIQKRQYDLDRDPLEQQNSADEHLATASALERELLGLSADLSLHSDAARQRRRGWKR